MKNFIKWNFTSIIVVVLVVVVIAEAVLLIFFKKGGSDSTPVSAQPPQVQINIDTAGITKEVPEVIDSTLTKLLGEGATVSDISATAKKVVFSDTVVNLIMSMSYPLLHDTLVNLGMLDFGEESKLYGTGDVLAKYLVDKPYTCLDVDGTRKYISDVLVNVGENWDYMNQEVTYTDETGAAKTTSLWNSIEWGVYDEESFYAAMGDMSCGLRTVLEVCLQSKEVVVNVNAIEAVLGTDAIDFRLDAAFITNNGEKTGYQNALIPLFVMLGLDEGEYPSNEEFIGYTELSDIWRAIFTSVFKAVDKIMTDPVQKASELLVNFVAAIDGGTLCDGLRALKLDGRFNKLAALAMGFEDKELFNLGDALIQIIGNLLADISGDMNHLLDSLAQKVLGEGADLPDMDTATLISLATKTDKNGYEYYTITSDAATDFIIDYISSDAVAAFLKGLI